jgi:isoleucyl-tRNA synthetase
MPFITEEVHERLVCDLDTTAADSVHLRDWPELDAAAIDTTLSTQMQLVRRLVELGRSARVESGMRTRQPLARAMVAAPGWDHLPAALRQHIADELNVIAVDGLASSGDLVDVAVKANFRSLGKRFGKQTPTVAAAIQAADAATLTAALRAGQVATVEVEGEAVTVTVTGEDVIVTETPRTGWAVASAGPETVALDLELTGELRAAGTVREIVRLVQEARKSQGLEVTDRIELWWEATGDTGAALRSASAEIAEEVLAVSVIEGQPAAPLSPHDVIDRGVRFWLRSVG